MAMKEDNDKMRDHLDFVVKGGDAKQLERRMVDGLFDTAGGSANFQTPHIDNAFDQYSDFQAASAAPPAPPASWGGPSISSACGDRTALFLTAFLLKMFCLIHQCC